MQQGSQPVNIQSRDDTERMLLSKGDSILIADCLDIPELAPEVERAVWQIEKSIEAESGTHRGRKEE